MKKAIKRRSIVLLAIILLNPFSLLLYLELIGIGAAYSQHRDKTEIVTQFSYSTPSLPREDSFPYYQFSGGDNWGYREFGDAPLTDWAWKPLVIYDGNNSKHQKIAEIIPPSNKKYKEYIANAAPDSSYSNTLNNTFTTFTETGKLFDSLLFQYIGPSPSTGTIHYPDVKITLFNKDGTTLQGPFESGKLYDRYAYKDGVWRRIEFGYFTSLGLKKEIYEIKKNADYFITIPGPLTSDITTGKTLTPFTFTIVNNKQYQQKPSRYLYEDQVYYWNLPINYDGANYTLHFTSIKNPHDLTFFPYRVF